MNTSCIKQAVSAPVVLECPRYDFSKGISRAALKHFSEMQEYARTPRGAALVAEQQATAQYYSKFRLQAMDLHVLGEVPPKVYNFDTITRQADVVRGMTLDTCEELYSGQRLTLLFVHTPAQIEAQHTFSEEIQAMTIEAIKYVNESSKLAEFASGADYLPREQVEELRQLSAPLRICGPTLTRALGSLEAQARYFETAELFDFNPLARQAIVNRVFLLVNRVILYGHSTDALLERLPTYYTAPNTQPLYLNP